MRITLTNDFHNTSAVVLPVLIKEGHYKGYHKISYRTKRKLKDKLCGSIDCVCGGNFGERGGAHIMVITETYERDCIIDVSQH